MEVWHGTTIIGVRKNDKAVIAGDGQVSLQSTVIKPNAKKVRRLGDGAVIGGFAGATADAFTLSSGSRRSSSSLTAKMRAAVELAKDGGPTNISQFGGDDDRRRQETSPDPHRQWRRAGARERGRGDWLGRQFALAAATRSSTMRGCEAIARKAMKIAAEICV